MTYTPEQMLESAETLDCQGSPFKTYAAMLRQGVADRNAGVVQGTQYYGYKVG